MTPALLVVCAGLSTWRLARLLTIEDFPLILWVRERIQKHGPRWLGELVSCPFCAAGWLALGIVGLADLATSVPLPWLAVGTAWAISAVLSVVEERAG